MLAADVTGGKDEGSGRDRGRPYPRDAFRKEQGIRRRLVTGFRWGVRVVAFAVAVGGALILFLPSHASFTGHYESSTSFAQYSAPARMSCISAWRWWTRQTAPVPQYPQNDYLDWGNYEAGNAACTQVLIGREHLFWTLIVLSVIACGGSFLVRLRSCQWPT